MNDSDYKDFFDKYILALNIPYYSIFFLDTLTTTHAISNMSHKWLDEFLALKMDLNSDIIIKSHHKLTPFIWTIGDIKNRKLLNLATSYNITMAATFIIKSKTKTILFNLYPGDDREKFLSIFNSQKSKIQFDLLSYFDDILLDEFNIKISDRELDVLNYLKIGKTNEEVALILGIKERTVRFHCHNILDKFNANSIKYVIFKATKLGII
ncbi:helix-turn-helix transcriptional regulator [Vibrio spartinae]|uniref:Transcriptional activator protein EsaR n=1 Tax=Vibrio spartinae TaxID=1918945 RepID=A0A1N6M8Y1_9VIBR|nr:helix-turn-helix transcriptional regulator [Vibrio spartinae]QMV16252.1 Transcriptional activator protein EsaR [Vibrio spartinae]SIO95903.1 Transcriptional activator protein EsaR [Vibrio spartinae]